MTLQDTGDELWLALESESAASFPTDLKNILRATRYDNILTLSKLSEKDYTDIENFMKSTLWKITDHEERKKYYDIFENCPEKFVLVGGLRAALSQIASLAIKVLSARKRQVSAPQLLSSQKNPQTQHSKQDKSSDLSSSNPSRLKHVEPQQYLLDAKEHLEEIMFDWFTNNVPIALKHTSKVSVRITEDSDGMFTAKVNCLMKNCTYLSCCNYKNKRWETSNMYKHARIHLKPEKLKKQRTLDGMVSRESSELQESEESPASYPAPKRIRVSTTSISSDEEAVDNPSQISPTSANKDIGNKISVQRSDLNKNICETSTKLSLTNQTSRNWQLHHHSRSERCKRKLFDASENCNKITDFFPILNEIEILLNKNKELKNDLLASMRMPDKSLIPQDNMPQFLRALLNCAQANGGRKLGGRRYSETLKQMSTLIFTVGGWSVYQLLSCNLPLPSISTVKRELFSTEVSEEGEFRFKELKEFLRERKLPIKVYISEDETTITGRVQYNSYSNQIVGLVLPLDPDGLPTVGSFPATSSKLIAEYFDKYENSSYSYVYVAQPVTVNAPSFFLALFGTNNKFNALHVLKRWNYITKKAKEEGIEILGFASDGDPRLLKAMRSQVIRQTPCKSYPWFQADLKVQQVYFQDTVHLAVKLKSKLLKDSCILPLGPEHVATKGHLLELINKMFQRSA